MLPLFLDYERNGRPTPIVGGCLFAIAVLLAILWGYDYTQLRDKIQVQEQTFAAASEAQAAPQEQGTTLSEEDIVAINKVLKQFGLPWHALFDALEDAKVDGVVLLSIEPTAEDGKLVISAESRSYVEALTYVARLRAQRGLDEVFLVKHELRDGAFRRPMIFSVSATWSTTSK